MKMAVEKDENLADLIRSQTGMDWDFIQADMHETSTEELIEGLTALKLYVNKKFAQEIAKRDDAVFYLRKLLQDGKHWRNSGPGDGWSPLHAIHILALIKSKESFELLLDIIRYHEDDLGNWVTEDTASLMVAFGEDFIEPIKEFTNDETLETFVRLAAASALAALGQKFPHHQYDIKQHLIKNHFGWHICGSCCT
jgi:HEAT repeat protein